MVLYRIGEYVALGRLLWDWLMSQLVAWMVAWNFAPSHGTVPPDSQSAKEQVHPMILFEPAFPMKSFSPSMGSCPFRVGSNHFHSEVCRVLGIQS